MQSVCLGCITTYILMAHTWLFVQAEGEEEETDKLVEQVMLEVGIGANEGLVNAPQAQVQQAEAPQAQAEPQAMGVDTDLEDRLNALRKG